MIREIKLSDKQENSLYDRDAKKNYFRFLQLK